jgi:hypothetical protein
VPWRPRPGTGPRLTRYGGCSWYSAACGFLTASCSSSPSCSPVPSAGCSPRRRAATRPWSPAHYLLGTSHRAARDADEHVPRRLVISWRRQRPTHRDADAAHALTGIAMAGMLVSRLRVLGTGAWIVVFGAVATWFALQAVREIGRRSAPGQPGSSGAAPAGPPGDAVHAAGCTCCWLYMLLAVHAAGCASRWRRQRRPPGAASCRHHPEISRHRTTFCRDHATSCRHHPGCRYHPASPRAARIAMGVTRGYLLIMIL